ncbi:MAG: transposase, partial [SAR202 cluster bacterium]|nr:transposase [SAR202 cluster bacterium]
MSVYKENKHAYSVGWNVWHLQWYTKYRYNVFKKSYLKNICVIAIEEGAKRHNIDVIDKEVDIDHVHVVASLPMTMVAPRSLQLLKGFSSRLIFKLVPNLRKMYPKRHL